MTVVHSGARARDSVCGFEMGVGLIVGDFFGCFTLCCWFPLERSPCQLYPSMQADAVFPTRENQKGLFTCLSFLCVIYQNKKSMH